MTNLAKMKEASISDLKDLESRIEQMTAAEYYNFLSLLEEYDKLTPDDMVVVDLIGNKVE